MKVVQAHKIGQLFIYDDKVIAAILAGANGYILKPFTRETFETKVTEVMARLPGPFV